MASFFQVKFIMTAAGTIFFVLLVVFGFTNLSLVQAQYYDGQVDHRYFAEYEGLLPAQVPKHELAGLDLYMDTLLQFALWCITIAIGIPLLKMNWIQNLLASIFWRYRHQCSLQDFAISPPTHTPYSFDFAKNLFVFIFFLNK